MEDVLRQLVAYLRGMWLYRWWGLAAAWLVGAIAAGAIYMLPDRYESSARIFVDTQSVLKPLMSGLAVQPNVDQQITILSRTLISRPNIEKLIRMADLDLTVKTNKQREELIVELNKTLQIKGTGRDNLFTLSYEDTQPDRAKRVVQSLVSIFVESGLGDKRKDTDSARRFIEEQIKTYEQRLDEAENRLKDFRIKNMHLMGSGKDYLTQVGEVAAQLAAARLALREAENSRDALQRQLTGEEPVLLPENTVERKVSIPEIDGRVDALEKNLDGLLQRYTEAHPDVVGTRRIIEQLKEQKKVEVAARRSEGGGYGDVNSNPVYQQMKLALADAAANVASLRARVAEFEGRQVRLQESAKLLPQVEAELAQLNRDYEINKKNYETLVSRRESANMSVEMESSSGMAEFRLIDPPSVPLKPSAPNRILLMPLGGGAALLFGLAFTFILSQMRPTFLDGRDLREISGLPLLGTVSATADPVRKRRRQRLNLAFFGGVGGYVGAFGVLTVAIAMLKLS
ncbi:XrtA system polysaccharide chain length determinant [Denitromonas ohlonensis]|jgi:polysaccharide chain length determinant protein (PEP-CTERM system associated)|uniref:Chain length-determining protein n=2 Tax=Denitromonas TaxID=139331 RepID=A0A558ERS0_9RHOO|nr:XrtA system polysaccharide chain length determinant [Denitromonas ohlonensis]TVT48991.1 MAG: chain length-determining protein [Denitromonas halophila]TVO62902.1 chain length-determining protein [Denitromonas ohlonensis]TVO74981.1 chain length-determining protein [Denitromonas ohlonensis]TVT73453.1 MAG: chain length-determining protein [Denitromonas halophila]TVT76027.1 MAG: chain length-determining protein [Denitromonas halophila]